MQQQKTGGGFGRPVREVLADCPDIVKAWERKELPIDEVLHKCGMSEIMVYRRLREYRLAWEK